MARSKLLQLWSKILKIYEPILYDRNNRMLIHEFVYELSQVQAKSESFNEDRSHHSFPQKYREWEKRIKERIERENNLPDYMCKNSLCSFDAHEEFDKVKEAIDILRQNNLIPIAHFEIISTSTGFLYGFFRKIEFDINSYKNHESWLIKNKLKSEAKRLFKEIDHLYFDYSFPSDCLNIINENLLNNKKHTL